LVIGDGIRNGIFLIFESFMETPGTFHFMIIGAQ
jgi:hypothetical protein